MCIRDRARTLDLVALILLVFLLLKKVLSASSYGHFTEAKELFTLRDTADPVTGMSMLLRRKMNVFGQAFFYHFFHLSLLVSSGAKQCEGLYFRGPFWHHSGDFLAPLG